MNIFHLILQVRVLELGVGGFYIAYIPRDSHRWETVASGWFESKIQTLWPPLAKLYHMTFSREGVMPAANKIRLTGLVLQNTTDDGTTQQDSVPLSPDSQMLFWCQVWVEPLKLASWSLTVCGIHPFQLPAYEPMLWQHERGPWRSAGLISSSSSAPHRLYDLGCTKSAFWDLASSSTKGSVFIVRQHMGNTFFAQYPAHTRHSAYTCFCLLPSSVSVLRSTVSQSLCL